MIYATINGKEESEASKRKRRQNECIIMSPLAVLKLELAFFRYFLTFAFKSFNTPTMTHEGYFRKERTEAAQP